MLVTASSYANAMETHYMAKETIRVSNIILHLTGEGIEYLMGPGDEILAKFVDGNLVPAETAVIVANEDVTQ
jgi:propanediol utilization protein